VSTDKEPNKVTIKISGERNRVLKTLKKIENIFPLFLEGKEKPNDNGNGIHVFLTVACPE
jgi:hypothetical protein